MELYRGQSQKVEGRSARDRLHARRHPAATARLPHGHRRPRADRAVRVGGRSHVRRAARTAGTDSDSALPEPRQPADRLHALPDRLLQIRRFGGRADGGTALHPRTDRVARRRRRRVRRGDAPRRSRHLPSRQGRRRLPPRDAHRTFRDPPHDRRTAVAPLGPHRRRGHHLGTHARIAGGAGLAHPARRIARRNARGRPMGTLRHPGLLHRPRSAGRTAGLHGAERPRHAESLDADHDRTAGLPLAHRAGDRHQFPPAQIDPAAAGFGLRRRRLAQNL